MLATEISRPEFSHKPIQDKISNSRRQSRITIYSSNDDLQQSKTIFSPIDEHVISKNRRSSTIMHETCHDLNMKNLRTIDGQHFSNSTYPVNDHQFDRFKSRIPVNIDAFIRPNDVESNLSVDGSTDNEVDNDLDGTTMTIKVQSFHTVYNIKIHRNTRLKDLWKSIDKSRRSDIDSRMVFPILFNHRMPIITDIRYEKELLANVFSSKASFSDERSHHLYIYFLPKLDPDSIYGYQRDPREIFSDSNFWKPHEFSTPQEQHAQCILLTSLYALNQYFRQPEPKKVRQRQHVELQFLRLIQNYIFPPAVMALVHALESKMFAFEKTILLDALLHLLSEFCPQDIEPSMLGTFMPNLICWLFEQCTQMDVSFFPCMTYDFSRYIKESEFLHVEYRSNETTSNEDTRISCEHINMNEKKIESHNDLLILLQHLKDLFKRGVVSIYDMSKYTVIKQLQEPKSSHTISRLNHTELTEFLDKIASNYPEFLLKTRKDILGYEYDQIVLLKDTKICVALRRTHRAESASIGALIHLFDPLKFKDRVSVKDIYDIRRDGPNIESLHPLLEASLKICRYTQGPPAANIRPIDQITMVLLDVSESNLHYPTEHNDTLTSIRLIVNALSQNLDSQHSAHAIGLIEFGSQIRIVCPITQDPYNFEHAVMNLSYRKQNSTRLYDAIQTAIDRILKYQSESCETNHKPDKLIICITNGINNMGNTQYKDLFSRARRLKIRLDLVSFVSDPRHLRTAQERIELQNMKRLCEDTKGFIYQTKHLSPDEMRDIFSQEVCLCIKERANDGILTGKCPKRKQSNASQQCTART